MIPDPTDAIREIKHRLGAESGFDVHRIAEETRRRQRESGRKYLTLPPRRPEAVTAGNHPMQSRGEVKRFEVDDQPSPPADR
ncbi:hypothetical protein [Novipirellula artificiosorum]|uniref:Uncharacterized protein n=1 Tax=Novipirellula artificiosorum TaxID=2528016 RepID=A0A5C6CVU6_9BACT|nr:hypothetical protein [Novipirellula artificiosorum]TWU27955.1 hypothetical protein Poly41_70290 [Novipirellula artificiosorum]